MQGLGFFGYEREESRKQTVFPALLIGKKMKQNEKYILKKISDNCFLFPSDEIEEKEKKLVFLNETSVFLWKQLEKNCSFDDLVMFVISRYDVAENIAYRHVRDFISFLSKNGCLDMEEEEAPNVFI